jgi:hypothetical protein
MNRTAGDELLSQFKVANFSTIEEEEPINNNQTIKPINSNISNRIDKNWEDIIPEDERNAYATGNEWNIIDSNLQFGSRSRHKSKLLNGDDSTNNNNCKYLYKDKDNLDSGGNDIGSDDYDNNTDNSDNNDDNDDDNDDNDSTTSYSSSSHFFKSKRSRTKTKRRNKKKKKYHRSSTKTNDDQQFTIKGLNTIQEVRRFVRSFRKFPSPLQRIDTIAQDANLEEKSQACLIQFTTRMQDICKNVIAQYQTQQSDNDKTPKKVQQQQQQQQETAKKRDRGPLISINGVKLYPQQILDTEIYFEPLVHYFSNNVDEFEFKNSLKQTYWDFDWSKEDDKSLLKGVYEYGYGNWEWIKSDLQLNLSNKILQTKQEPVVDSSTGSVQTAQTSASLSTTTTADNNNKNILIKLKPQAKHLRTRIDYLIKVLLDQMNVEKYGADWKKNDLNINYPKLKKSRRKSKANSFDQKNIKSPKTTRKRKIQQNNDFDISYNDNSNDSNDDSDMSNATNSEIKVSFN